MYKLPIYLSIPSVKHAKNMISNDEILSRVFTNFKGSNDEWKKIRTGISFVFRYCDSNNRYLGLENGKRPIDYAVDVVKNVCETNNISTDSIDLLIYGGIYREYFEPATAMEIASKLGRKKISAFDVMNACAGLMQSIMIASLMMQANKEIELAICCTTDFPDEAINYDIQSFNELSGKSAGLTLGGGASAWILSRKPLKDGGAKLLAMQNTSIPSSYNICQVPVNQKKFHSMSSEIFNLGVNLVPEEIKAIIGKVDWTVDDINHVVAHQPSKKIIEEICNSVGIQKEKAPSIHHLVGNTINSSIPMAMDFIHKNIGFKENDKLIFNSAAAGFTMVTAAAQWENGNF